MACKSQSFPFEGGTFLHGNLILYNTGEAFVKPLPELLADEPEELVTLLVVWVDRGLIDPRHKFNNVNGLRHCGQTMNTPTVRIDDLKAKEVGPLVGSM